MFAKKVKTKEEKVVKAEVAPEISREQADLDHYESLYAELQSLKITRISDLENLIANTKKAIK